MLAAGVAVVAGAGAITAVVVSSRDHGSSARPVSSSPTSPGGTTAPGGSGTTTTQPGSPPPLGTTTSPVPATTAELPPAPNPRGPRRHSFVVGVVDDSLAQVDPAAARQRVELSHRAGFDAVVITATWKAPQTRPPPGSLRGIHNVARAAKRDHMRLFLVVWHGLARNTPKNAEERDQFASFAAAVVRAVPETYGVIVGNEPNLVTFWKPQFGPGGRDVAAAGYEDLLARTYDAIKDADSHVRVIGVGLSPRGADRPGGIRPTHSPATFIRDLGAAYRASGRRAPLMDSFAIHPYMVNSAIPPTVAHPKTTQITLADYPKLVTLLDEAFRGTPQRGRTLPIIYAEFGVQTRIPDEELGAYEGAPETETRLVSPARQAEYYRQALALAYCQPTVKGLFIFHTFDEFSLEGWQSGLYYADGTPKPSVRPFRRAVAALRDGSLATCGR
jgi:hypothetical protein